MSTSPNGKHTAQLHYEGEIRYGPAYFTLSLDGKTFPGRLFGDVLSWSPDSNYLAVQEWLTTDYLTGPVTRVLLIDLEADRCSELEPVQKGFAQVFQFIGDTFGYRNHFLADGHETTAEVVISRITNWKKAGLSQERAC
jgi:hypothetical protein